MTLTPDNPWSQVAAFLGETAASAEAVVDVRWRRLKRRMGWDGVPQIVPYTGYANDARAWFHGRVLANPPRAMPGENDSWWDNLVATYRRLESDEVPGVEVEVDFAGARRVVTSDEEGYFQLEAARHPGETAATHSPGDLWQAAAMRIVGHDRVAPAGSLTTARLMTPSPDAAFGVVSDMDDTVLQTDVVNLLAMARHTFFHNARTRLPLAGAAEWYRALQRGGSGRGGAPGGGPLNPIWYVSSSPWNLHDLLEDFLELNDIPHGPILLRDLGLGGEAELIGGHGHKLDKTLRIMDAFPSLPFVLVGDSGQEDADLYASAAEQRPGRVAVIFIRDVDPDAKSGRDSVVQAAAERAAAAGAAMHCVTDSLEAARVCRTMGLVDDDCLQSVGRAVSIPSEARPVSG